MLSETDQTELPYAATQNLMPCSQRFRRWTTDDDREEIGRRAAFQDCGSVRGPPAADARLLALAADVVAPRARSRDAAVPPLAAQPWPDRTAMADFARVDGGGHDRGHGTRARCLPA